MHDGIDFFAIQRLSVSASVHQRVAKALLDFVLRTVVEIGRHEKIVGPIFGLIIRFAYGVGMNDDQTKARTFSFFFDEPGFFLTKLGIYRALLDLKVRYWPKRRLQRNVSANSRDLANV